MKPTKRKKKNKSVCEYAYVWNIWRSPLFANYSPLDIGAVGGGLCLR